MRLVLASNNPGKLVELQRLFDGLGIELVTQGSLGIAEAEEPHHTFVENALAKARHAAASTGLPAIADDSGLCVDALGGAPGVASAHYAPLPNAAMATEREAVRRLQDEANNALLLERMAGIEDRRAAFCCTLVAVRSTADPGPLVATGRWPGEILRARRGTGGFGYDPLVFIPAFGATVADLPAAAKNAHSHRARAATQLRELLREAWQPSS